MLRLDRADRPRRALARLLAAAATARSGTAAPPASTAIGRAAAVERVGPAGRVRSLRYDHRGQLWVGRADGLYRLQRTARLAAGLA